MATTVAAHDHVTPEDTGTRVTLPEPESDRHPALASSPETDIEEGRDSYRPGGFHPVYIGDILADKYEVLNKIGYGVYSTVWLVKDLTKGDRDEDKFRALKVLSAESYAEDHPIFERKILKHLRDDGNKKNLGYPYICHLVDDFEHRGPNGTHVCLVFELMGETLRTFGAWFNDDQLPKPVIRRFTIQLQIESGYLVETPIPIQDKAGTYTPIPSVPLRNFYFTDEDGRHVDEFDIALGDWGVSSWATNHLTEHIQPVALRAPEVLIKAPWDKTVDWWNFGALLLELYPAVRMFSGRGPPDGRYKVKRHIAEIGDQDIVRDIFDDDGKPKGIGPLERPPLESEAFMPGLREEDRKDFGSFLRAIMKINPADRLSTEDLLGHPWLGAMK
ncbi:serine-threonineeeee protein kinase [Rhypophila sp. PSN 637]